MKDLKSSLERATQKVRPRKYNVDEDNEARQTRYRKSIKNILKKSW